MTKSTEHRSTVADGIQFGHGDAYYGIRKTSEARWDFHGEYKELGQALKAAPEDWKILVSSCRTAADYEVTLTSHQKVCMDNSCKDQWFVVWENAHCQYQLCDQCSAPHLLLEMQDWLEDNGLSKLDAPIQ